MGVGEDMMCVHFNLCECIIQTSACAAIRSHIHLVIFLLNLKLECLNRGEKLSCSHFHGPREQF